MSKTLSALLLALAVTPVAAAPVFSDDFNSYLTGNLVGQGAWQQTGTSTVNPLQVAAGVVLLGTTGQDVNAGFSSAVANSNGTSFYVGLTLNVSAAQATGDYFLHDTPNPGNSTAFFDRLFVKASGVGYVLGYQETSGNSSAATYGTGVLSFGMDYRVVMAHNYITGPANDTGTLYVNPTDAVEARNVQYLIHAWSTASSETNIVGSINLRQGTVTSAATLSVDNLVASLSFSDAMTVVPEPSSLALLGTFGLLASLVLRRQSENFRPEK